MMSKQLGTHSTLAYIKDLTKSRRETALVTSSYAVPVLVMLLSVWIIRIRGTLPYPAANVTSTWDHNKYIAMAGHPFAHEVLVRWPPFCWRILVPLMVHVLPLDTLSGFYLITVISLCAMILGLVWFLRGLGLPAGAAMAGGLSAAVLSWISIGPAWDYMTVDPLAWASVMLGLGCAVHRKGKWLLVTLVIGAFTKELAVIPAVFAVLWALERRDGWLLRWALTSAMSVVLILVLLRHFITPLGPATPYSLLGELQFVLSRSTPDVIVKRFLRATVMTWGVLLPVAALHVRQRGRVAHSPAMLAIVAIAVGQLVISRTDVERLVVVAFPVVIAACVMAIEQIAKNTGKSRWRFWGPLLVVEVLWNNLYMTYLMSHDSFGRWNAPGVTSYWIDGPWPYWLTALLGALWGLSALLILLLALLMILSRFGGVSLSSRIWQTDVVQRFVHYSRAALLLERAVFSAGRESSRPESTVKVERPDHNHSL